MGRFRTTGNSTVTLPPCTRPGQPPAKDTLAFKVASFPGLVLGSDSVCLLSVYSPVDVNTCPFLAATACFPLTHSAGADSHYANLASTLLTF